MRRCNSSGRIACQTYHIGFGFAAQCYPQRFRANRFVRRMFCSIDCLWIKQGCACSNSRILLWGLRKCRPQWLYYKRFSEQIAQIIGYKKFYVICYRPLTLVVVFRRSSVLYMLVLRYYFLGDRLMIYYYSAARRVSYIRQVSSPHSYDCFT